MKLPVAPKWLPSILERESFLHWHAFTNTLFHNHDAQSAIALARIGATEERVKSHYTCNHRNGMFKSFVDVPDLTQATEVDSINSDDISDYLGKDVGYYKILDYFTKLFATKYNKDVKKFLRGELPTVIDGQLGSEFHGNIQTGYGYSVGSDQVVLEGIALSYEQYKPVKSSTNPEKSRDVSKFGRGTTDITEILKEAKKKREAEVDKNPDAWKKITAVAKNYGDIFLDYADNVKLPDFFDPDKEDMNQAVKLMDWVLDMAAVVYVQSEFVNDFFLLHGITGAWSLLQLLDVLDYKTAVMAVRAHLAGLIVVFARINPPGMTKRPEDYWRGDVVDQAAWDELLQKSIDKDYEAHVHKVIQCLYEAWKKNPNGPYAKYQIAGGKVVLDTPRYHFPGQ